MTGNDTNIIITDHAVERYIERYATNLFAVENCKEQRRLAEEAIKKVFCFCDYISDNEASILFRHRELKIDFLVKHKRLITIYPTRTKKNGKQKHK